MYEGISRDQLIDKANLLKAKLSKLENKDPKRHFLSEAEMFRRLIEHSKDYIVVTKFDIKVTLQYLSPSYEEILDYKIKDHLGKSAFTLIHPEDKLKLFPMLKRYVVEKARLIIGKEGREFTERFIFRLKAKNGEWRNIDCIVFNCKDRLFYVGRDITERLNLEQKLKDNELKFQLAASLASDIVYEWDLETNKIEWYGDIGALLGYKEKEFGKTIDMWLAAIHPEDREHVRKEVEEQRGLANKRFLEYRIKAKNGEYRCWEDRGSCIVDNDGKHIKMIGTIKDVTSRKILAQVLSVKIESLEKVNQELRSRELTIIEYKDIIKKLERDIQKLKMNQ